MAVPERVAASVTCRSGRDRSSLVPLPTRKPSETNRHSLRPGSGSIPRSTSSIVPRLSSEIASASARMPRACLWTSSAAALSAGSTPKGVAWLELFRGVAPPANRLPGLVRHQAHAELQRRLLASQDLLGLLGCQLRTLAGRDRVLAGVDARDRPPERGAIPCRLHDAGRRSHRHERDLVVGRGGLVEEAAQHAASRPRHSGATGAARRPRSRCAAPAWARPALPGPVLPPPWASPASARRSSRPAGRSP